MNIATCIGPGERAELHILVKHAEAARHSPAISHVATRDRVVFGAADLGALRAAFDGG